MKHLKTFPYFSNLSTYNSHYLYFIIVFTDESRFCNVFVRLLRVFRPISKHLKVGFKKNPPFSNHSSLLAI